MDQIKFVAQGTSVQLQFTAVSYRRRQHVKYCIAIVCYQEQIENFKKTDKLKIKIKIK